LTRRGAAWTAAAVANLPFDLLVNTLGWLGALGLSPCYAGTSHQPAVGWVAGSLVFKGGPIGQAISLFSAAFTPASAIFLSGPAWDPCSEDERSRLINHELWHARRQFGLYTGWIFWPAYLAANLLFGVHEKNPFESGRKGPHANVDARWTSGYKSTRDYVEAGEIRWLLRPEP
ncbi:MAG: hypothetical protein ACRDIF_07605, partial [Actinomycetota bacterium]